MMKFDILIVLAFACCPISSVAEDFTGRMDCEVKSNKVTGIIEGKPVEYTGYQDGIEVGDTLAITYQSITGAAEYIAFRIRDGKRDKLLGYNAFGLAEHDTSVYSGTSSGSVSSSWARFALDQNEIWFFDAHLTQVNLVRYYKSDWQGIATFATRLRHHTATLDCRHTTDKIDEMLERMRSSEK